jgi:hypothetical protein
MAALKKQGSWSDLAWHSKLASVMYPGLSLAKRCRLRWRQSQKPKAGNLLDQRRCYQIATEARLAH